MYPFVACFSTSLGGNFPLMAATEAVPEGMLGAPFAAFNVGEPFKTAKPLPTRRASFCDSFDSIPHLRLRTFVPGDK